jgi:hypothetical protein
MKIICASVGLLIVLSSLSSVSSAIRHAADTGQSIKTVAGDKARQ